MPYCMPDILLNTVSYNVYLTMKEVLHEFPVLTYNYYYRSEYSTISNFIQDDTVIG